MLLLMSTASYSYAALLVESRTLCLSKEFTKHRTVRTLRIWLIPVLSLILVQIFIESCISVHNVISPLTHFVQCLHIFSSCLLIHPLRASFFFNLRRLLVIFLCVRVCVQVCLIVEVKHKKNAETH